MKTISLLCAWLFLFVAPAWSFDLSKPVLGIEGKNLQLDQEKDAPAWKFMVLALNQTEGVSETEKLMRFKIMLKLMGEHPESLDLSSAEIDTIIRAATKPFSPLVVGRLIQVLDPARLK